MQGSHYCKVRIVVYFGGQGGVQLNGEHREPSGVTDKVLSLDLDGSSKAIAFNSNYRAILCDFVLAFD